MAISNAEVSSQALRGLQDNLTKLSTQIREICDTLNSDRDRLGQTWRDNKFQEFRQGFQRQIDRCSEIAEKYNGYAKLLSPVIDQVVLIESADVVGDGSSSFIGGSSAADVSGTSAINVVSGKAIEFNM